MYKSHKTVPVPGHERPYSSVTHRPEMTSAFTAIRLKSVELRGRSSFGRSTVKNQIPAIDSFIEGAGESPLKRWGGFACALILFLMGLVASTPLLAQYDSAQISGTVHDQTGAVIAN